MFSLDLLLEPQALIEDDPFFLFTDMIEMMQICNLAELPDQFNGPEYISPLSGNSMRHIINIKKDQVTDQHVTTFELYETSIVNIYLETEPDLDTTVLVSNR
jgi:hypothetical protein